VTPAAGSPTTWGAPAWAARGATALRAARLALQRRDPGAAARAVRELVGAVRRRRGFPIPERRVRVAGRTFLDPTIPGWPSPALDRFLEGELERISPTRPGPPPLHFALLGVTRRCGLRCQHCSDGDLLGAEEALPVEEVVAIAGALADLGSCHLELTGGEPMLRLDAVEAVARMLGPRADVWVLTSGTGLDAGAARRMRGAGVVGVMVSLDHWDAARHDAFRGVKGTFERAVVGARTATGADLVVGLSCTVTRETTVDDLRRLAALGAELGAGFLRLLEPRAVGRWAGRDVALRPAQVDSLLRFAAEANRGHARVPIVELPALGQRAVGCFGAGDRYLFVDAAGEVHACPFCRGSAGSARHGGLPRIRDRLRSRGCHAFPDASPGSDPVRIGRVPEPAAAPPPAAPT
jgi:MoaA/NifB/PqqE/SkfB family radical SAM enzyme